MVVQEVLFSCGVGGKKALNCVAWCWTIEFLRFVIENQNCMEVLLCNYGVTIVLSELDAMAQVQTG